MRNVYPLIKKAILVSCAVFVVAPAHSAVTSQTYTIDGTVFAGNCPINPVMTSLCMLSPVPGCTVSVSYQAVVGALTMIYPPPTSTQMVVKALTDTNGKYSVTFDAVSNSTAVVSAFKAGEGASAPVAIVLKNTLTTLDLVLQKVTVPPPPANDSATLQGTVYTSGCPGANPSMPMPCYVIPVPQCTVVVAPMFIPMIDPLPPRFLPRTTVTDAKGHYSLILPAGEYIVSAQKTGLGSAQETVTLNANQIITVDLSLAPTDTVPVPPVGRSNIKGTVEEVINPPNPGMGMPSFLEPVPGCTVMVCATVLPLIPVSNGSSVSDFSAGTDAPAVLTAGQYITITDANGHYFFNGIPVLGKEYSVTVMAKKGLKFGRTQADLEAGETVTADIIIAEILPIIAGAVDPTVVVQDIYQQYFTQVARTLDLSAPTAISVPLVLTKKTAEAVRISGNNLIINLKMNQRLTIKALSLNGHTIATLANDRFFYAGANVVPLISRCSGPMLLQVKGATGTFIVKVNVLRHR
ncbi:MAG: carboxypeptidase-like regulatory domain-containing protein [Chitinispirillaceae bacterium]|jgi:hypothetical protein